MAFLPFLLLALISIALADHDQYNATHQDKKVSGWGGGGGGGGGGAGSSGGGGGRGAGSGGGGSGGSTGGSGGWGWGGGGGGYWSWGCGKKSHNKKHGGRKHGHNKDYYVIGEFAQCMKKGTRCRGMRLDCPLHCGGTCFYDCRHMCKAHCFRGG